MSLPFFIPAGPRHYHKRARIAPVMPAAAFALVSAEYVEGTSITLSFSRAINIVALDGSQILVDDGEGTGLVWMADGEVEVIDPETLSIGLSEYTSSIASGVYLDASATNGIVAADGSGAWPGVTGLALPFP